MELAVDQERGEIVLNLGIPELASGPVAMPYIPVDFFNTVANTAEVTNGLS